MWGAVGKFVGKYALKALPYAVNWIGNEIAHRRGKKGAQQQNAENVAQSREMMNFQREMASSAQAYSTRMSNTAYQRKVEDLTAAGLNPALAYEGGGATAPQGVMAGGSQARMENVVSSGMQAQQIRQAIAAAQVSMESQIKLTDAEVKQKGAQTALTDAQRKQIEQSVDFEAINQPVKLRHMELQNKLIDLGMSKAEAQQAIAELAKVPIQGWEKLKKLVESFEGYNPAWWAAIKRLTGAP